MRAVRTMLIVVAIVVAAWFALAARQAHDVNAAAAIASGPSRPSATQARQARSLLSSAGALNPDTQVDVLRAELDLDLGDRAGARTILERVVSSEPDNAVAWEWLARASVGDLREFYLAAFRIDQLVPTVHGSGR